MPLNEKQQQAVEYLDGPLLVLAGPGTGKTQLLSAKVAYILEHTDTNPENILCLTFTEAGANNMRERLLSMVGQTAGKVNIHTYHSFGSDILAKYKNYAESFDRNLDETIDTVTQYRIIEKIINDLSISDILKSTDIKDIISTIAEAKTARLTAEDLRKIAEVNLSDTEKINAKVSSILETIKPRIKFEEGVKIYEDAGAVIAKYASPVPITCNIEKEANELLRSLTETIETESQKEKPSISALTKWRSKFFEKDKDDHYRLKNLIANKKLLSFSNVMEKYESYLEENKLFDFADMIEESIKILKTDDGFRYTLQEQYQYFLLDEFQDTNPSQFELIHLLADPEKKPDIMAVGDDDQAIFAFQGANASNLLDFSEVYQSEIIKLTENYRSTSEILEFSHKIADQIESSFAKKRNIDKTLNSVRNDEILDGEERPLVSRHEFKGSDAEYAWVAKSVHELIKSGTKQSNIAIITPKHKYITPLLPYLKAYDDINIAYEKRENVLEDQYIHELATLSRFIYEVANGKNPAYRLLEILTFPFFKIPAIEAISVMRTDYGEEKTAFEYLKNSENESLKKTAILLSELIAKSFETPLELFIDYLTGNVEISENVKSPFLDFYKEQSDFTKFSLYENLSVLRENIKSHIKVDKPRLKDFIDFLDDYEAAGEAILNTSPYQDSSDSVQIVTAHKSKGLEYEHVFIIATDDLSWGNSKGNNNKLSLPVNLQSIRHTGITEDECLRLFFVAITRAKKTLTMTNSKQDFSGKNPNRLEYLGEYEAADDVVVSPLLRNTDVVEHNEDVSEEDREENIEKFWISSYLNPSPDLKEILKKSVENFQMTATNLTTFIDIVYSGPIDGFYERNIIHGPSEPMDNKMLFGNLIHSTFENVTNNKLSKADALKFFEDEVNKNDFDEQTKNDMLSRGKVSLEASLDAFEELLKPKDLVAKAEVNLNHEHLMFEDIRVTGKIDHINIDEENKTIEIFDFKTGNFHKEKWNSHATLYKYALQLNFYKLLLNLSPTYSKYKIERAHILFVSPNNNDLAMSEVYDTELVHDKVYEFNEADEKDFKDLLRAVYKHIKSLDFIDESSPLAVHHNEALGIKDIKEFCELIKNS